MSVYRDYFCIDILSSTLFDALFYGFSILFIFVLFVIIYFQIQKVFCTVRELRCLRLKERRRYERIIKNIKRSTIRILTQEYRFIHCGKIASGILHDISNIVTIIQINIDELIRFYIQDSFGSNKIAQRIQQGILSLNRLLSSWRKNNPKLYSKEYFSLIDEIQSVLDFLSSIAKKEYVALSFINQEDMIVYGNSSRFYQAISNIVMNAIHSHKGSKKKDKHIHVSLEKQAEFVIIKIIDNGKGIDKKDMRYVFDAFFTRNDTREHSGLGLFIARHVIENDFQGEIRLESQKRKGTICTIRIPTHH